MDITVLNKEFEKIGIVDTIESIIWSDRYSTAGEFELYTRVTADLLTLLQEDFYLQTPLSDKTMVIDTLQIKTDIEFGNRLLVTGSSLESIINRRIVLQQTLIDDTAQVGIQTILNENMISSTQPKRNIPNMVFSVSADPTVTAILLEAQYDGENIFDIVEYVCTSNKIGFRLVLNAANQLVFSLYAGKDRSYNQTANPFVVFSPNFDNLISSDYLQSSLFYKTYALIFGDITWPTRPRIEAFPNPKTDYIPLEGLDRREMFIDMRDLSKIDLETSTEIPEIEYNEQAKELAQKYFKEHRRYSTFDGQADTTVGFVYRTDYDLGDIVQIENEYGLTGRSRITEVTISENASGISVYPVFEKI